MAKYSGYLGCIPESREIEPGIWTTGEDAVELFVVGDIISAVKNYSTTEVVSDDMSVSNRISIVANSDVINSMGTLRYVTLYGKKWKITSVEMQGVRLILSLGGLWNG